MSGELRPYWMVHNPEHGPAREMHAGRTLAENEARRLAKLHPGQIFYVLGAEAAFSVRDPVERTEFDTRDELPF